MLRLLFSDAKIKLEVAGRKQAFLRFAPFKFCEDDRLDGLRKLVEENARVRIEQAEYQREYDALATEYDRVNSRIQAMEDRYRDKEKCRRKLEMYAQKTMLTSSTVFCAGAARSRKTA